MPGERRRPHRRGQFARGDDVLDADPDAGERAAPAPGRCGTGSDPRRIERLLARRRLPVRSVLGTPGEVLGVWLKSALPSRGFEYLFRKSYKL